MDNSITDITLLDCNSKFCEEKLGGNLEPLALYTNKMGHGIQVNAGDKISIQSAFISELGAGEDSIELSDQLLEQRTVEYVDIVGNNSISACNQKLLGFESASAVNTSFTVQSKGNSTSILFGFYKTNNGENCFHLPRRFVNEGSLNTHTVDNWKTEDSILKGQPYHPPCVIDTSNAFNNDFSNNFIADADYFWYQTPSISNTAHQNFNTWKMKSDNSRFQIFVRKDTWYGLQQNGTNPTPSAESDSPSNWEYLEYLDKLDISLPKGFSSATSISETITSSFRKQKQPQAIEIYSSANNSVNSGVSIGKKVQKYLPISTKVESSMYRTFYSASPSTNNASTWNYWTNWLDNACLTKTDGALKYLSSHQYIGVKRPELFKAIRKYSLILAQARFGANALPSQGWIHLHSKLLETDFQRDSAGPNANTIVLNLAWQPVNLEGIRDIFLEQEHHPELFNNRYNQFNGITTVNNSRFLHCNQRNNNIEYFSNILGGDNILENASALSRCSCPIFVDYNPAYSNLLTDGISWEDGYAYGFAKKFIKPDGTELISLTTSHMNKDLLPSATATTIPTTLFRSNDGTGTSSTIEINTNIGFDTHFNSFGNVCIGMTTGWCYEMYHEIEKLQALPALYYNGDNGASPTPVGITNNPIYTSDFIQEIYLGADQPVCSFNTTTNRFEIAQLHTPEFVQNPYNAGGVNPSTTASSTYVDEVATAGDRVYKINKRLNNSTFTPDMKSYEFNEHTLKIFTDTSKSASALYNVDFLNPNLEAWAIYDQLCGVLIKDFGYTNKTWNDGIWGILGFTYNQFNASRTSLNDISTRVGNDNKNALPYAFTNADVNSGDTINFVTNSFGAGMFNLNLPATMSFNTDNGGPPNGSGIFPTGFPVQQQPAITSPQTSVILSAPNLPQKLLNGYFTVRSDVLEDASFLGGYESGALYPVISIVDKVNDTGNFFTQVDSSLEFTFTKPKTITAIKTSIHNPSQELANVDKDSAVVYKITRTRPHQFNIIDTILNPPQQSKNKK